MTDDQKKLLAVFEARVRQLMFLCDAQRTEIARLKLSLNQKEQDIQQAQMAINDLNTKYDNLMMARIISVQEGDLKNAKQRLSKLVREVDKCIALLNE